MSCSIITTVTPIAQSKLEKPRTLLLSSLSMAGGVSLNPKSCCFNNISQINSHLYPFSHSNSRPTKEICRAAAEYKFPDPIPEFADEVTEKFRTHLLNKLSKRDLYEDSAEEVVDICTEIFSTFLHTEYGGPGTLLVVPFIDMAEKVHERGLPGASQAARAAVKWAQAHVDKDWKEWTGTN